MSEHLTIPQIAEAAAALLESLLDGQPIVKPYPGIEEVPLRKLRHVTADPIQCPELRYTSTWLQAPLEIFVENVVRKPMQVIAGRIAEIMREEPGHEILCFKLLTPRNIDSGASVSTKGGIRLRLLRNYEIEFDSMVMRFDVCFGLRPIATALSLTDRTVEHQLTTI